MSDAHPSNFERALQILGQRQPLDVLESTPTDIQKIIERTPREVLTARPFADKWTPLEIVGHLIDAEFIFGTRLRQMLTQNEPQLPNWDQDASVARQRFNDRDPYTLVKEFALMRGANLPLWQSLTPGEMSRGGVHTRQGRITIGMKFSISAGHDLLHLDQMRRYIAAVQEASSVT